MAARKPCKRGKVRRRVKGGRTMCVAKKKAAPKKKRAAPKRRGTRKSRASKASARKFTFGAPSGNRTWYFDWTSGGFNTVQAKSMAEALQKAREKGEAYSSPGRDYRVVASSLRPETEKIRLRYAAMSD